MTSETVVAVLIALLGGGGLAGGITALLRARPETGRLIVEAAEGAVVVQSGVIDALRTELGSMRAELDTLREELDVTLADRDHFEREANDLRAQVEALRRRLALAGIGGHDPAL